MKHCWNETSKGKPKYCKKNLSQRRFFQKQNRTGTGLNAKLAVHDERKLGNSGAIYID